MMFAAGWRPNDLLDLSIQQIVMVVGCVIEYRMRLLKMALDMVGLAKEGVAKKEDAKEDEATARARAEVKMLHELASLGLDIEVVRRASDG